MPYKQTLLFLGVCSQMLSSLRSVLFLRPPLSPLPAASFSLVSPFSSNYLDDSVSMSAVSFPCFSCWTCARWAGQAVTKKSSDEMASMQQQKADLLRSCTAIEEVQRSPLAPLISGDVHGSECAFLLTWG